ncbi:MULTISPECIES: hypothetical protein [Mycobacterium ulcerans group]|uniref:hypothetical protein n=1 Tax=Mycobacterium ulcerans group TaxID=2993898 RepID=UPI000567822A
MFVIELVTAAAVTRHPDSAPQRSLASAEDPGPPPVVIGDRTVRLINLGGANSDLLLSRVGADIHAAVNAVVAFWGTDWAREISVVAAGSDEQFRTAAGGGTASQWADIAAVTVAERFDPGSRAVAGQRIVFAPGAVKMSATALRIVLTHELFHYAARVDTALDAPRWLTEGVADFVARPTTSRPAEAPPAALPSDDDLDIPGPARSRAYDRAWWFTRFVADTYGTTKLRDLYLAACGPGHSDLPRAALEVLGTDAAGLLAGWQQWMSVSS